MAVKLGLFVENSRKAKGGCGMMLKMSEHEVLVDKRVNELSRIFEQLIPDVVTNWSVVFEPVFLLHSDALYPERYTIRIQGQLRGMWIDHTPELLTRDDLKDIGKKLIGEAFGVSYAIELNASPFTYRRAVESLFTAINSLLFEAFKANKLWPFVDDE